MVSSIVVIAKDFLKHVGLTKAVLYLVAVSGRNLQHRALKRYGLFLQTHR